MPELIKRGGVRRLSDEAESRASWINPTADVAIALADGDVPPGFLFRPMKVERLIQAGGKLTDEEQARVHLYHLGDSAAVAREMGRPESWVHQVCAWDIDQRRQASQSA